MLSLNSMIKEARASYFASLISSSKGNSSVLFKSIEHITAPAPVPIPVFCNADCNRLKDHFLDKVNRIRANISPPPAHALTIPPAAVSSSLFSFSPVTLEYTLDLLRSFKPSSHPHDFLPLRIALDSFDILGPTLVQMINLSLSSGVFPSPFKHAVIQPLLKKPNLDPSIPSNIRPISKLVLPSKLIEKAAAQ